MPASIAVAVAPCRWTNPPCNYFLSVAREQSGVLCYFWIIHSCSAGLGPVTWMDDTPSTYLGTDIAWTDYWNPPHTAWERLTREPGLTGRS